MCIYEETPHESIKTMYNRCILEEVAHSIVNSGRSLLRMQTGWHSNGRDVVNISRDHMLHLLSSDIVAMSMHSARREDFPRRSIKSTDSTRRFISVYQILLSRVVLIKIFPHPFLSFIFQKLNINRPRCYQRVISSRRRIRPRVTFFRRPTRHHCPWHYI